MNYRVIMLFLIFILNDVYSEERLPWGIYLPGRYLSAWNECYMDFVKKVDVNENQLSLYKIFFEKTDKENIIKITLSKSLPVSTEKNVISIRNKGTRFYYWIDITNNKIVNAKKIIK